MASFPNRCQHIKVNGTQCGCPALRRNKLCYFHKRHHEERVQLNHDRARSRPATIDLPVLEDANSIQVSLMQIMRLLVSGRIDHRTAGLMLYALQTASHNLSRTTFEPNMKNVVLDPRAIGETPLGAYVWEESDFESEEEDEVNEAEERETILKQARPKAKATKNEELIRRAEAEADRLAKVGAQEREATRKVEAAYLARREANDQDAEQRAQAARNARPTAALQPVPAITHAATAMLATPPPKPAPPAQSKAQTKRQPTRATLDETRDQVRAIIRKAAPAMLAAVQARRNAETRSGRR